MFDFKIVGDRGNNNIVRINSAEFGLVDFDLEIYHNGHWFVPTKKGLEVLHSYINDEKVRTKLIMELRKMSSNFEG